MKIRAHNFSCSFTLIELVVALGMVAILAGSLFVSMKLAFGAKASAEKAIEPSRTAELAMEFVRNDLENALAPHDPSTYTSPFQYLTGTFEGTDNTASGVDAADLTFYTTADMKDHLTANGEIKEVELTLEVPTGSTQRCLVRKCSRNLLSETTVTPDEEILCRNVTGFTVRYFDGSNWDTSWDSTAEDNTLPAAVEVTMTLDRSTPKEQRILRFVRVFPMACSTAAFDTQVNSGATQ
jgi:type II secretory pathway component PulJ